MKTEFNKKPETNIAENKTGKTKNSPFATFNTQQRCNQLATNINQINQL